MTKYKISLFQVRYEYREVIAGLGIHQAISIQEAVALLDADSLIRETQVLFLIEDNLFLALWIPIDILGRPILRLLHGSEVEILQRGLVPSAVSLDRLLRDEREINSLGWQKQKAERELA